MIEYILFVWATTATFLWLSQLMLDSPKSRVEGATPSDADSHSDLDRDDRLRGSQLQSQTPGPVHHGPSTSVMIDRPVEWLSEEGSGAGASDIEDSGGECSRCGQPAFDGGLCDDCIDEAEWTY